jgi:G:T-mismatch repair DNA endonuclease (very short patch repair protein)
MICLECGKQLRSINFKHLRSCCGLSPSGYLQRHPGAALIDDDVRAAISRPGDANPNWQGGRTIKHCECGKRLARSNRSGLCPSCARSGDRNPFSGKHHSARSRERMREAQRMRDPSTYRGGGADPELLSELRRREWARRTPEEKQRHLSAFIAAGQVHNRRSSKTRIEILVAQLLDELGLEYSQNVQIGRYNVDFVVGGTIVECYGDFWHCNPALWSEGDYNRSLHLTAREKWERDRLRQVRLQGQRYRFISLWESDILRSPDLVRNLLITLRTDGDEDGAQAR